VGRGEESGFQKSHSAGGPLWPFALRGWELSPVIWGLEPGAGFHREQKLSQLEDEAPTINKDKEGQNLESGTDSLSVVQFLSL
jgi:hypothetical protein